MYDDVLDAAENRAYLQAKNTLGPNLEILNQLPKYEELKELEEELQKQGKLRFDAIFEEPTGFYLLKCFLIGDFSVDKAVFIKDVELFRKMRDPSARLKIGRLIHERFVDEETGKFPKGESVFERRKKKKKTKRVVRNSVWEERDPLGLVPAGPSDNFRKEENKDVDAGPLAPTTSDGANVAQGVDDEPDNFEAELRIGKTNAIGVYGPSVQEVQERLTRGEAPKTLFDAVALEVLNDLRMDVFPRFETSPFYKKYIRLKSLERQKVGLKDITMLKMLGRGAFGSVNACIKKNTGKLYACKCISKRRVMATDSVDSIMSERNVLAVLDSDFVCSLKYSFQDNETLYLVMDLMMGGDLKFHLNKEEKFSEVRSRFYSAEVLLGLEHIHSKGVIYRDIKLENILLDAKGHCKVSDLGLAVMTRERVKGYAGTPGYTAPEVILMQPYDKMCDFFSFGVLIYRLLSGRKPFGSHMGSSDLDKNVVSVEPEYPEEFFSPECIDLLTKLMIKDPAKRLGANGIEEIKQHPWFDPIDWGLLEAGYLDPPFVPKTDEINADSLKNPGRPHQDDKYRRVKLTEEFQKSLEEFPFKSTRALQKELVEVMEKADDGKPFDRFPRRSTASKEPPVETPQPRPQGCCSMM
jgi:serine/threonine protein kinase